MLGYTREEFDALDRFSPEITHADDIAVNFNQVTADKVLRGDMPNYQMEKRYFRKNGTRCCGSGSASVWSGTGVLERRCIT